jgi:hypothetical protein
MPARVVLCFFQEVINTVCSDGRARVIHHLRSESAPTRFMPWTWTASRSRSCIRASARRWLPVTWRS